MNESDNIAAVASAIGGAVTVIRLSGPGVLDIANNVWKGRRPLCDADARKMMLGKAGNDPTLAVYMKAPASYTGGDVVELQCHGGAAAADQLMRAVLSAGCRLAEPGEFTYRAFMNGKMDLLQAEAVADIVSSGSEAALRLAENQLAGRLSSEIDRLWESVNDLRSECEARLDFPDEELDFDNAAADKISGVAREVDKFLATGSTGAALRDGVAVVLAGKPNAGKSSLLNMLLGFDRAIVSNVPGTTRDTVEARTVLRNIPVRLTDTAGLRDSDDIIEKLGIERSYRSIASAQVTFWLLDATAQNVADEAASLDTAAPGVIAVWNKCDLAPQRELPHFSVPSVHISALTGENMDALLDAFEKQIFSTVNTVMPEVAVNARTSALLEKSLPFLRNAENLFRDGEYELAAAELAAAAHALGEIIGKNADPDLLDNVFHRFCLGK